ncbi:GNAT family N-acetyltransferase, partial [Candidatus Saccharibacteria bacterium]|nr:GNAT family N-acetyltransferase [Candidatus Saccharibacteria bacterium]
MADIIKRIPVPDDFNPPTELTFEDLVAKPLTRSALKDDLEAVNSSAKTILKTRGGSWPTEELSEDFDLLDLAWHEREFRDKTSFAYVVYDQSGAYIGCFYLYPIGERTPYSKDTKGFDIDASWWVTTNAYNEGYYEKLYAAIQVWLANEFSFANVIYSN